MAARGNLGSDRRTLRDHGPDWAMIAQFRPALRLRGSLSGGWL